MPKEEYVKDLSIRYMTLYFRSDYFNGKEVRRKRNVIDTDSMNKQLESLIKDLRIGESLMIDYADSRKKQKRLSYKELPKVNRVKVDGYIVRVKIPIVVFDDKSRLQEFTFARLGLCRNSDDRNTIFRVTQTKDNKYLIRRVEFSGNAVATSKCKKATTIPKGRNSLQNSTVAVEFNLIS